MQQIWNVYRRIIHSNMPNYFWFQKVFKLLLFVIVTIAMYFFLKAKIQFEESTTRKMLKSLTVYIRM